MSKWIVIIVFVMLSAILGAFTTTHLWVWFIVPLGVPAIGMAHAWGIIVFIRFLTYQYLDNKITENWIGAISFSVVKNLTTLGFGYIAVNLM